MNRFNLLLASAIVANCLQGQSVRYVTSPFDSGPGTFRDVVGLALSGDTIRFQITGTITLTSDDVEYNKDLVIEGPGMDLLTLNGNDLNVPIHINGGSTTVSELTISNGNNRFSSQETGGGVGFVGDTLIMRKVRVVDCVKTGFGTQIGGGLYADGLQVRIDSCIFDRNIVHPPGASGGGFARAAEYPSIVTTSCYPIVPSVTTAAVPLVVHLQRVTEVVPI